MKRLYLLLILLGGLLPAFAQTCTATATNCGYTITATAPPGGTCEATSTPEDGWIIVYNAAGEIVETHYVYCEVRPIIDPC